MEDFDFLHNIETGKHLYQFYKEREDLLSSVFPFIQAGLKKKEACLLLISEKHSLETVKAEAEYAIHDCAHYLNSRQFQILSADNWYLTDGHFDISRVFLKWEQYLRQMRLAGYSVFRVAGDAGCVPRSEWRLLQEYERKAVPVIKANSMIALCAYPIMECTPSQTKDVLEVHEDVLIGRL